MLKVAHIINPVRVTPSSDLFFAQPVTFRTMQEARRFSQGQVEVEFFSAQYSEDKEIIPQNFFQTPDLTDSILNYQQFNKPRKLPLIVDILERLYQSSHADYFVYTNVDIALLPHFYAAIQFYIHQGYDGLVINRRTISGHYQSLDELPYMYADMGKKHPGWDCFVFRREAYPKFQLGKTCIGANGIGRLLLLNVMTFSKKFIEFKDEHLTFHIGNDGGWRNSEYLDYYVKNNREVREQVKKLKALASKREELIEVFEFHLERLTARIDNPPMRMRPPKNRVNGRKVSAKSKLPIKGALSGIKAHLKALLLRLRTA